MNLYETTFIINPQADDAAIDRQIKAVADLISTGGGNIVHEERIGTKRLAYEIAGLNQGYFTSLYFEGPPTVPSTLDKHFKLEDPYVRHLTVVFEGDIEAVKESRTAVSISSEHDADDSHHSDRRNNRSNFDRGRRDDRHSDSKSSGASSDRNKPKVDKHREESKKDESLPEKPSPTESTNDKTQQNDSPKIESESQPTAQPDEQEEL